MNAHARMDFQGINVTLVLQDLTMTTSVNPVPKDTIIIQIAKVQNTTCSAYFLMLTHLQLLNFFQNVNVTRKALIVNNVMQMENAVVWVQM